MTRTSKAFFSATCALALSISTVTAPAQVVDENCPVLVTINDVHAQSPADFTRFVQLGDSVTAGFTDGCWVKHGQQDSYGAILARQVGTDFQQPLLDEPGVGGCLVLTSLAPTFTRTASIPKPLNLLLPRPYNNLAVPGYRIQDVTDAKSSADNGNPLTDLVLRGQGATALQMAAVQQPTFITVFIGNNDVLGAGTSGTVIEGATLTRMSTITPRLQQIVGTMKAAQGGTGKGIFITVPDITSLPFFTTIPPFITNNGQPVINPATGRPFTFLSQEVLKQFTIPTGELGPVAPIPENAVVTLQAAGFLATGYGIPCALLDAGGAPAADPRRLHCNQPLPDDANPIAGTPGVVLYPDEVASLKCRTAEINAQIASFAQAAGYQVLDGQALFADIVANGRDFGGIHIGTSFLSGGFFSYDGIHPTSLGYAIVAEELIKFINAHYGNNIHDINMAQYLFQGNSTGGYPTASIVPLTSEGATAAAADIWTPTFWRSEQLFLGERAGSLLQVGNGSAPEPHDRAPRTGERREK
jgi:lysophospholipase L1-like esterase